jgi:threonine/homoserine/homoserine lactone efflux protein
MQGLVSSITNTKTLVLFVSFFANYGYDPRTIAGQFVLLGADLRRAGAR